MLVKRGSTAFALTEIAQSDIVILIMNGTLRSDRNISLKEAGVNPAQTLSTV